MDMTIETDTQLSELYKAFNRKYFGGELPETGIDVFFSAKLGTGKRSIVFGRAGRVRGRYSLKLSRYQMVVKSPWRLPYTLIHEMIHIWEYMKFQRGGHGANFHGKAMELKRMGVRISYRGALYTGYQINKDKVGSRATMQAGYLGLIGGALSGIPITSAPVIAPTERIIPAPSHVGMTRNAFIEQMLVEVRLTAPEVIARVLVNYPGVTTKQARQHVYSRRWYMQKAGKLA